MYQNEHNSEVFLMHIFVAYRVNNDDIDFSSKKNRILDTVDSYFGKDQMLFAEEDSGGYTTLVFRIQKPLLKEMDIHHRFFEKIKSMFTVLSTFTPHFTQEENYAPVQAGVKR